MFACFSPRLSRAMFLSVCFVRFPFPSRGRAKRGYYRCERREESVKTCGDARTKGRLRLKLGAGSPPEAVRETRIPRRLTRVKPTPHWRLRRIIRETQTTDEWRSKNVEISRYGGIGFSLRGGVEVQHFTCIKTLFFLLNCLQKKILYESVRFSVTSRVVHRPARRVELRKNPIVFFRTSTIVGLGALLLFDAFSPSSFGGR